MIHHILLIVVIFSYASAEIKLTQVVVEVGDRVELDLGITTHTWERRVAAGIQYNTYCWDDMSNFATCGRWMTGKYSRTVAADGARITEEGNYIGKLVIDKATLDDTGRYSYERGTDPHTEYARVFQLIVLEKDYCLRWKIPVIALTVLSSVLLCIVGCCTYRIIPGQKKKLNGEVPMLLKERR